MYSCILWLNSKSIYRPYSHGPTLNCTQWTNDRIENKKQKTNYAKGKVNKAPKNETEESADKLALDWLMEDVDVKIFENPFESKLHCGEEMKDMLKDPKNVQDGFDDFSEDEIIMCANKNTDLITLLKPCQLNYILTSEKIIKSLESKTIVKLLEDDTFIQIIQKDIPFETMAKLVQIRPEIVTKLRKDYPAARYISSLLKNVHFLKRLPKK